MRSCHEYMYVDSELVSRGEPSRAELQACIAMLDALVYILASATSRFSDYIKLAYCFSAKGLQ